VYLLFLFSSERNLPDKSGRKIKHIFLIYQSFRQINFDIILTESAVSVTKRFEILI